MRIWFVSRLDVLWEQTWVNLSFLFLSGALVRGILHGTLQVNSMRVRPDPSIKILLVEKTPVWPWSIMCPKPSRHSQPSDLLCDGLRFIWTQRVVDEDKVIRTVILDVEKRESDKNDAVLRSTDLPLTPRLGGVAFGVPWWHKFLFLFCSLQTVETLLWEWHHWLHS